MLVIIMCEQGRLMFTVYACCLVFTMYATYAYFVIIYIWGALFFLGNFLAKKIWWA